MGSMMIHKINRYVAQIKFGKQLFYTPDPIPVIPVCIKQEIAVPANRLAEQAVKNPSFFFLRLKQIRKNIRQQIPGCGAGCRLW